MEYLTTNTSGPALPAPPNPEFVVTNTSAKLCAQCLGPLVDGACCHGHEQPESPVALTPAQLDVLALCGGPWVPCPVCQCRGHVGNVQCRCCGGGGRAYHRRAEQP